MGGMGGGGMPSGMAGGGAQFRSMEEMLKEVCFKASINLLTACLNPEEGLRCKLHREWACALEPRWANLAILNQSQVEINVF